MNLFLTFVDLSYIGMAKVTPYVYYDPLLFLFFVNLFQHGEEFPFQFFNASEATRKFLFNKEKLLGCV